MGRSVTNPFPMMKWISLVFWVVAFTLVGEHGISADSSKAPEFVLPEEYRAMALISGDTYEERAENVVRHMASMTIPEANIDFKYIGPYVFAKLSLGLEIDSSNKAFDAMLDHAIETLKLPASHNQFNVHSAMHGFLMNEEHLSEKNVAKLKLFLSKTNPKVHIKGTINMTAMYASAMLLACEKWPNLTNAHGYSSDDIRKHCREKVLQLLHDFFYRNGCEIDAFTYFATNTPWVRMLAEFSTDEVVRARAENTYQKMIATLVAPWNQGYYNNCPYRSKGWHNLLTGPHEMNAINQVAWVFFGNPSNKVIHFKEIRGARASLPNHLFWVSYEGKIQARPELLAAEKTKTFPYEFTTVMLEHGASYYKYAWQSENYGQSSQTEILDDLKNAPRRYGYKEVKRNLLQWKSDTKHCVFSVCQDNPERPTDFINRNTFGYGENPYHRVFQSKNVSLGIFSVPEDYLEGKYYQIYVPFSKAGIKHRIEREGWVFSHTGTMMFAFRTIEPYTWNQAIFSEEGYDMLSLADATLRNGGWILETTEITEEFQSESMKEELNKFSDAILQQTKIQQLNYDSETPGLSYIGLNGNRLEIEFFPPTEAYNGQYRINDQSVPLEEHYLLNSPFIQQTRTSPVKIINGTEVRTIEFDGPKTP